MTLTKTKTKIKNTSQRNPFRKLYQNVLNSAKPPVEKGQEFGRKTARLVEIDRHDLEKKFNEQDGKCALTGVVIDLDELYVPNSIMAPSVDRINPNGDYTYDNIHIVLRFVNFGRGKAGMYETVNTIESIKNSDIDLSDIIYPNFHLNKPDYDEIFVKPISEILTKHCLGYINILMGSMNIGKTYTAFNTLIPELMTKKDVKLFYYYAPNLENIEEDEFRDYIDNFQEEYEDIGRVRFIALGGGSGNTWYNVKTALHKDYTVIVGSTDKTFKNIMDDDGNLEFLRNLGDKLCLIRDEIHYGSTSHPDLYKDNTGGAGTNYKARLYHMFQKVIDTTPWLFGFSATPTKEMLDDNFGATDYKIQNEWVSPNQLTGVSAWINRITHSLDLQKYDDDLYLRRSLQKTINSLLGRTLILENLINTNVSEYPFLSELNTKTTGVIAVDTTVGGGNPMKAYLNRVLTELKHVDKPDDFQIGVTTQSGWEVYDSELNLIKSGNGNDWLGMMNEEDSNVRLLIVVMKGSQGVNIPSLTDGIIFRNPKTKDSDGEYIVRQSLQLFGRWVRKNWGGLTEEQIQYELPRELALDILQQLNTFDLDVPDSPQWRKTVKEFKTDYASHMVDVLGFGPSRKTKL